MLGNRILKILLLLMLTSCLVSPDGDDSPDCATGEVFDKLTRSCSAGGLAPQPSLRSFSISEDVETTVALTYSDTNNGQANNCSVFNVLNSNFIIKYYVYNKNCLLELFFSNSTIL